MGGLQVKLVAIALSALSVFSNMTSGLFVEQDPDHVLLLVNRDHKISYEYEPPSLVSPNVLISPKKDADDVLMREEPARALERLFSAANAAGHTLYAVSGYRSYQIQKGLYQNKVNAVGEKKAQLTVAPPGASEHQLGLAMDVNGETTLALGLVEDFGHSPEGQWVYANAHKYGFIIRYKIDKTDITGYAWEPWHLRYVGVEVAEEIFALDITFEEYHEMLQQQRVENWVQGGE